MNLKLWLAKFKISTLTKRIARNKKCVLKLNVLTNRYKYWIKIDKKRRDQLLHQLTSKECSELI